MLASLEACTEQELVATCLSVPGWFDRARASVANAQVVFFSRRERTDYFRQGGGWTSLQGNHSRVHQGSGRAFLRSTSLRMWLQVLHESNLANRMQPESIAVLRPEELLARFGLEAPGAANPPWSSSRS